jgi:hypothetical protein
MEEQWFAAEDPRDKLLLLRSTLSSERKLIWFALACLRGGNPPTDPSSLRLLFALEHYADGLLTRDQLDEAYIAEHVVDGVAFATFDVAEAELYVHHELETGGAPASRMCRLLDDVFGNPFHPVAFDPSWRTATAVGLAQSMYESRDFAAMPILADALEEAGCDSPDVLAHCRDPNGVHVRGCWVVDLVLGKA